MRFVFIHIAVFLALLFGCAWATVAMYGSGIESALAEKADAALAEIEEMPPGACKVEFSGRRAVVSGEVHEKAWIGEAERRVAGIHGVGSVENRIAFRHMDSPWLRIAVHRKDRRLDAEGLMPEGQWRVEVLKTLRGIGGSGDAEDPWRVTAQIEEKTDVLPPKWLSGIGDLLPSVLARKRAGSVTVRDGMATLEGELFSESDHKALTTAAVEVFAPFGVEADNRFAVVPPPVPPSFSIVWSADAQANIDGTVAEEPVRQRMERTIRDILEPDRKPEGAVGVGENIDDAEWEEALMLTLEGFVSAAKEGSFAIDAGEVRATGIVTSHGMRESILQLIEQQFPEEKFSIKTELKVVEPPRPSIVSVIRMPGDAVRLKGVLPSAELKRKFMEAARARLREEIEIGDEIEIKANATEPEWLEALVAMLPMYVDNTERGGLTVYGNSLAIEAKVGTEKNWDTVWALTEQYFPDGQFQRLLDLKIAASDDLEDEADPLDPDAPLN